MVSRVSAPIGVLLMTYGSPESPADLAAYVTDIRRGRPPTEELLVELAARYERIGGVSPLGAITSAQAAALQDSLDPAGRAFQVFVGMKHWSPRIAEAVDAMAAAGIRRAVGVVLAPHYSRLSVGEYHARVRATVERLPAAPRFELVDSWYDRPSLVGALARRVAAGLQCFTAAERTSVRVVFTAHSLPARILVERDPYPDQVNTTAARVAERLGLVRWSTAWQSAGRTAEPWLGPDIKRFVAEAALAGESRFLVCPVGFVADHLETLFDLDVDLRAHAERLGVRVERTASLNADPDFVAVLSEVVLAWLGAPVPV